MKQIAEAPFEHTMLTLYRGEERGIEISPRWPSSQVNVDERAFRQLLDVQARLPAQIRLILTRGYEAPHAKLGHLRKLFRGLGVGLFRAMYFKRRAEIPEIFGANGHDVDGTHVDVSIRINGRRLRFLRLGVFTPRAWQENAVRQYQPFVAIVKNTLRECGFHIHRNETESLQIHCDLIASLHPQAGRAT
ncbi:MULTISPECIES: hypothetical protein [unclassified Bosea (in: a-proteobacteria)]|uniref:hypothetical protein n=1 Tax=unclassified Bosea (in: a-proteobacteria) TaxID=2653178 RepID=UPI0019D1199E|nr:MULTISPECIES: hypothetical protein [unclassified Bosea (in: a-proteobacteria)]